MFSYSINVYFTRKLLNRVEYNEGALAHDGLINSVSIAFFQIVSNALQMSYFKTTELNVIYTSWHFCDVLKLSHSITLIYSGFKKTNDLMINRSF